MNLHGQCQRVMTQATTLAVLLTSAAQRPAASAVAAVALAAAMLSPATHGGAHAQPTAAAPRTPEASAAPLRLRIVGGLAGVNQYTRHEAPFWTQTVPRLSQGRIAAEIVPHDQAGIRSQEMLRLIQLGAVPFGTALLSRIAVSDPELAAADLAGLNPDMATLRRNFAAFRPYLERTMPSVTASKCWRCTSTPRR